MSESQFNYLFTLKNAHLSSNSYNFRMQPNILWNLQDMRPESSSVNSVNLAKKNYYNSGDIEFFLGDYFFGAPCIFTHIFTILKRRLLLTSLVLGNQTDRQTDGRTDGQLDRSEYRALYSKLCWRPVKRRSAGLENFAKLTIALRYRHNFHYENEVKILL